MTTILAFSAKKQGGKTTAVNDIRTNYPDAPTHNFADALKIIVARTFMPADLVPKNMSAVDWIETNKHTISPCGLTVRQLLQVIGTDVFRAMWADVWVNAWKHRLPILNTPKSPKLILVADVRFPNEVKAVQALGGRVIRLTRAPYAADDIHASETALDGYKGFDMVVDNSGMTIEQQNQFIWDALREKGWLPK